MVGSQGAPGKQGESAHVGDDPHLPPKGGRSGVRSGVRPGYSSAPAGTPVDKTLPALGMAASGLVRLSAGRLGDDGEGGEDEGEVGVVSLPELDLVMKI